MVAEQPLKLLQGVRHLARGELGKSEVHDQVPFGGAACERFRANPVRRVESSVLYGDLAPLVAIAGSSINWPTDNPKTIPRTS